MTAARAYHGSTAWLGGTQRQPRYVREYARQLEEIGIATFKRRYLHAVLVGFGILAKVTDRPSGWPRRTLEVDKTAVLAATQSTMDRVWQIRKDAGSPRGPRILLGNAAENDIVMPDYTVSTQHCAFSFQPGRALVADLGSLNGTALNGEWLRAHLPVMVPDRSAIVVGRLKIQYLTRESFFLLALKHADFDR